jgi:hypothetical protein
VNALGLVRATGAAHIKTTCNRPPVPAVRDILKLLNDRSAGDLAEFNDEELRSFETLCENWRMLAEAEYARRKSLPRPQTGAQ